jgi:DNA-directed RNA polymerase subunit RPC12/RpoP
VTAMVRKCLGCGWPFRSHDGERYCCATCAARVVLADQLAALRRLASQPRG